MGAIGNFIQRPRVFVILLALSLVGAYNLLVRLGPDRYTKVEERVEEHYPIKICAEQPATLTLAGPVSLFGNLRLLKKSEMGYCTPLAFKDFTDDDMLTVIVVQQEVDKEQLDAIQIYVGKDGPYGLNRVKGRFSFRVTATNPTSPTLIQIEKRHLK